MMLVMTVITIIIITMIITIIIKYRGGSRTPTTTNAELFVTL